ncbi:MAG: cobalamin B12-binding domain-containing protein [Elusimicrobia bacterium]|nr:cobalamin B12-binding domain-containing protein [Elusimicrobiota bacterium]
MSMMDLFTPRQRPFKSGPPPRRPRKDRADVLLVYPIWVMKAGRGTLQRMLPPLGVLSIAANLERHGYEVHVIDLHAEELNPAQFRAAVRTLRPRFVGITVWTPHFIPAHHIASICKAEVPDVRVIAGGTHAKIAPEQMLQNPAFDAVCRGDGEDAMLEFVRGAEPRSILGLSWLERGRVVHNPPREISLDLDAYPFPAYHLIDLDLYFPPVSSYRDLPAINVLMTRGCPGKCTFCNSANTTLRSRSPEKMVELLSMLRNEHGIRQAYFYDDTFTANPKSVREFCRLMLEKKVDMKWMCYVRGDMFTDALAELMARAGCHQVLMGVESGSSTLMAKIGKPIQKEKYLRAVQTAHRFGIEVRGSFIIGHLGETRETMVETVDFAKEMDVDFFQLSLMVPYPGTALFNECRERGLLFHEDYSRYGPSELVMKLDNLEGPEVVAFEKRSFFMFYMRPRILWRQVARIANWQQFKDLFKAARIILLDGISAFSRDSKGLQGWLDFDLAAAADPAVAVPAVSRLTYSVKEGDGIV